MKKNILYYLFMRILQKYQMGTLPNPSRPRPRSAKRGGQGRGLFINPLPWRERARVRGLMDFCKSLLLLCSLLIAFWGCGCATATTSTVKESLAPQEATLITGIDIQDYTVTITANKPFIYTIYRPIDPFKMTIELPDVNVGAFNNRIVSEKAGITEIVPYQIESPSVMAKIEMLLPAPSIVEPGYKDNVLIIRIKEELPKKISEAMKGEGIPEKEGVAEAAPAMQEPLPEATEISSITFERSAGVVKVLIKGNGSMTPNVFPLDDRIVIDVPDVVLSATLPSVVVSPVKGIRSGKHEDKVRLVLDLKEKTNFDVAAVGGSIVIALQRTEKETPAAAPIAQMSDDRRSAEAEKTETATKVIEVKEPEALVEGKYTGKKLSLDFQDADIGPIFRLLADISGYNIVVSPEVKGKLTMKLINVPWDQAMDLILKTFSLGKDIEGNIIRIAPTSVFVRENDDAQKTAKSKKEAEVELSPLERKTYHIVYANAEDVKFKLLGQKISSKYDDTTKTTEYTYSYDEKQRILSPRGSAVADRVSNILTVSDVPIKMAQVDDFIKEIDQPTMQVMIEARIVEVNTNLETDLGIQWGGFLKPTNALSSLGGFSGLNPGPFTGENFLVDFPGGAGAGSGGGFTFGILNPAKTMGLDLQLSAVETLGKGKVITNPRILTMDRQEAKIMQGKSIPVRKLTTEGTVSTEFKDVVMELTVTPAITREKTIDLKIKIKKEELDATVPSIEGVPGTDKKEAYTNVRIQDGETIVIGGLYKIITSDTDTGVPGLMRIPILKWLFKKNLQKTSTSELLIFITPRIVITERKT
jgi:type IV pilus assembly protein PilQ